MIPNMLLSIGFMIALLAFALVTGYMVVFGCHGAPMLFPVASLFSFVLAAVFFVGIYFGWGEGDPAIVLDPICTYATAVFCGLPAFAIISALYHRDGGHAVFCAVVVALCLLCAAGVQFIH